jgi:hypothetical protein
MIHVHAAPALVAVEVVCRKRDKQHFDASSVMEHSWPNAMQLAGAAYQQHQHSLLARVKYKCTPL